MSVSFHDVLPRGWRDLLVPKGPVGIGLDPGTTTKKTSNPTGLALIQQVGADYIARLVVRFKTSDPDVVILETPIAIRTLSLFQKRNPPLP